MNIDEIESTYELFHKYKKLDKEFLILCLKHDFNNLFIENKDDKVIFDFKQNQNQNIQILTHDETWFKPWIDSLYVKKKSPLNLIFRTELLNFDVYIEYFKMSGKEYHVKIKKLNMPHFDSLSESSNLKKSINLIILKNKLLSSLSIKPKELLTKL